MQKKLFGYAVQTEGDQDGRQCAHGAEQTTRGWDRLQRADYVAQTIGTKGAKGTELGEGRGCVGLWGAAPHAHQQPGLKRKPSLDDPALHPGPLLLDGSSGFRGHLAAT